MVKIEINVKRIAKILLIVSSIFLVFPFLICIGYYTRVFIESRKDMEIPRPIETSDKETIATETGVVIVN